MEGKRKYVEPDVVRTVGPAWDSVSLLKKSSRRYTGVDVAVVLQEESVYYTMLDEMIQFFKRKFVDKIGAIEPTFLPFDGTSCSAHVHGRLIVLCECQRHIASTIPKCLPIVEGCGCKVVSTEQVKPMTYKHSARVICVLPHLGDGVTCVQYAGISRYFDEFSGSMPTFVKLVKYLWITAGDMRVINGVLGCRPHGAFHVVSALFVRLCMSDSCYVINKHHMESMIDDQPLYTWQGTEDFRREVLALRSNAIHYKSMNRYVQFVKLDRYKVLRAKGELQFVKIKSSVKRRRKIKVSVQSRDSVDTRLVTLENASPIELRAVNKAAGLKPAVVKALFKADNKFEQEKVKVQAQQLKLTKKQKAADAKIASSKVTSTDLIIEKLGAVAASSSGSGSSMAQQLAAHMMEAKLKKAAKPPRVPKSKVRALDTVTPNSDRLLASGAAVYKGVFNERDSELADIERFRDKRPSEPGGKKKKKSGK